MDPADDAYERVTNPERFRVLHDAAHRILDEFAERYAVTDIRGSDGSVPFRELVPEPARAGRVRITFTAFPGVRVKLGRKPEFALPACGCDACDDDPDTLIGELRERIGAGTTRWRRGRQPGDATPKR